MTEICFEEVRNMVTMLRARAEHVKVAVITDKYVDVSAKIISRDNFCFELHCCLAQDIKFLNHFNWATYGHIGTVPFNTTTIDSYEESLKSCKLINDHTSVAGLKCTISNVSVRGILAPAT